MDNYTNFESMIQSYWEKKNQTDWLWTTISSIQIALKSSQLQMSKYAELSISQLESLQ